jgi:hypothetical protein
LTAFGVDQLNAQRMFCCRSAADARKAIIWSSVGQFLTLLMLLVGAALFVYYSHHGVSPVEASRFADTKDYVFPAWITTTLPIGLRGLILAGIFAAAISSLDSILAALSQTTLALFVKPHEVTTDAAHQKLVRVSRILVVVWGIGLSAFAILLNSMRDDINMVSLAFGMAAYTVGPMLGLFLAALLAPRSSVAGLTVGVVVSFLLVMYVRSDVQNILVKKGVSVETIASWGGHDAVDTSESIVDLEAAEEVDESRWRKVVLRGTVTGVEEAEGSGLDAWPMVTFDGSDVRVFVGRSEKKANTPDLATLRDTLVSKTIAFRSELFPNGGQLAAILSLGEDGSPVLVDDPKALSGDRLIGPKALQTKVDSVWMWPLSCFLTLGCGIIGGMLAGPREGDQDGLQPR